MRQPNPERGLFMDISLLHRVAHIHHEKFMNIFDPKKFMNIFDKKIHGHF